jgi:serine/threonine-protein kinase RsbW
MRSTCQDGSFEVVIPSDPVEARRIQDQIAHQLKGCHFEEGDIFSIKLALEEALVNAIKHGNQMDRGKNVRIHYAVNSERFDIRIEDEGPGFNPDEVPDPLAEENLERPCGRGLLLMRHYMTEVNFHPPGNRLIMSKVRHPKLNGHSHKAAV